MTETVFHSAMKELFAAHGRKEDQDVLDRFWKSFKHFSDSEFQRAIDKSCDNDDKFPTIPRLKGYVHAERAQDGGATMYFSFTCKNCDLPFAIKIEELTEDRYVKCGSCEFYHGKIISWNGAFLHKKMEEAKAQGITVVYI